ncbi:TrmH family RNA methyltransferase [Bacteroidota bacterium]
MIKVISSVQNPFIKEIISLMKSGERRKKGRFLIEGFREVEKAIQSGYQINELIYQENEVAKERVIQLAPDNCNLIEVSKAVFSKLTYREGVNNILAIATARQHILEDIHLPENPLILVLESVEKPGNLGAILRTCDAAAIDLLLVCDPQTDIYNPNVVRSSLGCVFTVQIAVCNSQEALIFLKSANVNAFVSSLDAAENYHDMDYTASTAIVMGSEAFGVSENWLDAAKARIKIPMRGLADSMNVSNAAAILIYEAKRQRGFV